MAHCTAWRPSPVAGHDPEHTPQDCLECWRPHRERVDARGDICRSCIGLIIQHPNPDVRASLLSAPNIEVSDVELLASDSHITVALAADSWLSERGLSNDSGTW